MFSLFFGKARSDAVPQELYGTVVAQARLTVFFTDYHFEDTVTGRFDLLALHLYLFSRRLVQEDSEVASSLNQEVFDHFTDDVDRALRELGVGDTSVPKRKKKMIRTFYALVDELNSALEANDLEELVIRIAARFDRDQQTASVHLALANYVLKATKQLERTDFGQILKGVVSFPDPAYFLSRDES